MITTSAVSETLNGSDIKSILALTYGVWEDLGFSVGGLCYAHSRSPPRGPLLNVRFNIILVHGYAILCLEWI